MIRFYFERFWYSIISYVGYRYKFIKSLENFYLFIVYLFKKYLCEIIILKKNNLCNIYFI